MATGDQFRSLNISSAGVINRIADANTLRVGNGIDAVIGLTVSCGTTIVLASATQLAANIAFTAAAGTGLLDFSSASGIFFTSTGNNQLSGDVYLASNKNFIITAGTSIVDFSHSSGTFDTPTGTVTIGPGAVILTGNTTVQAGVVLATTGSGNINLPNNGSARFQIAGSAVGATVTATNLNTLTNTSNADALHTHSGISIFSALAEGAIPINVPVAFVNNGGSFLGIADADISGTKRNCVGFALNAAAGTGNTVTIQCNGQITMLDSTWDVVAVAADTGKKVFLSENEGKITLTAPVTSGSNVQKLGIVAYADGIANTTRIAIQIGDAVTI